MQSYLYNKINTQAIFLNESMKPGLYRERCDNLTEQSFSPLQFTVENPFSRKESKPNKVVT